jgi:hypothetical protein
MTCDVMQIAAGTCRPQGRSEQTWPRMAQWRFSEHVRDHVTHIHIGDAAWNLAKNDADYNCPGEGKGRVRDMLKDAFARGYDAGIGIEPHMVVVFHDAQSKTSNEAAMKANFVECGRRLEKMLAEIKAELRKP